MSRPLRIAVFALGTLARVEPSLANEPTRAAQTLEQFGENHRDCAEWSDGCAVCVKGSDDKPDCSLPGISCQPSIPMCRSTVVRGGAAQPDHQAGEGHDGDPAK